MFPQPPLQYVMQMDINKMIPVTHYQNTEELKLFLWMYQAFAPKKVVELGSFNGATLWTWINFNRGVLTSLTSVDLSIGPDDGRYQEMLDSKAKWEGWTEEYRFNFLPKLEFNRIEGNTMEQETIGKVKTLYQDNDVDMLFIDADHAYTSVKADYYNYRDIVRPGGWIVFHDTYGYNDVRQLFDEIKSHGLHFEICNPGGWGISVLIKK